MTEENKSENSTTFDKYFPWALGALSILLGLVAIQIFKPQASNGTNFMLTILAMMLISMAWVVDRYAKWKPSGMIMTALLGVIAVVSAYTVTAHRMDGLKLKRIHTWNAFHYVMGTKYFSEVGFENLYKACLLADREDRKYFSQVRMTRSMHDYSEIPVSQALKEAHEEGVKEAFTPKRWRKFKIDLRGIQRHMHRTKWSGPLLDLGFHPSPAWLIIHRPFLNQVTYTKDNLVRLCALQLPFFLLTFILLAWAFGMRTAVICAIWFSLFFGNKARVVGGYFSYDWFFLLVAATALFKKGWPALSTPFLAFTAMMRGFPGLLASHQAVKWTINLFKKRSLDRKATKYLTALVACCLIFVILGSFSAHGFKSWLVWKDKMQLHSEFQPLPAKRVGLKYIFANDLTNLRYNFPRTVRIHNMEKQYGIYKATQIFLILMAVAAMARRNDYNGYLLGFVIVFAGFVESRYYASSLMLLLTWTQQDKKGLIKLTSDLVLFGFIAKFWLEQSIRGSNHYSYFWFNIGIMIYFVVVMAYFLGKDYFKARQEKRQNDSKPEDQPTAIAQSP